MRARTFAVTLLCLTGGSAFAQQTEGMPDTGFVFNLRLGGGVPIGIGGGGAINTTLNALPAIAAGVRLIGRLELTLGMNFARFEQGTNTATSVVSFVPTLVVDIARSADRKAAFYGKFGLPLGVGVIQTGGGNSSNSFIVGFDFGLGVRYAFHRMFALGFEGGASGLFVEPQDPNPTGITIFYAVLVGTFYYGR
jgi:hypothetical protein